MGIGRGLRVKVNANIGTAPGAADADVECQKMQAAVDSGADTLMDLSLGGNLGAIRGALLERCPLPLGTVPLYEAAASVLTGAGGSPGDLCEDKLFEVIERQAQQGVDFITIHCGLTERALKLLRLQDRCLGIVSRGGSFIAAWMLAHGRENPLYERYDELLDIARRYDVTLSLGDGLRPGCLADAGDGAQIEELVTLGELVTRARAAEVLVMLEGPGHVPLDQVQAHVRMQKAICRDAPFYVLGPLLTDIAPGYDHISGAIGGAFTTRYACDVARAPARPSCPLCSYKCVASCTRHRPHTPS